MLVRINQNYSLSWKESSDISGHLNLYVFNYPRLKWPIWNGQNTKAAYLHSLLQIELQRTKTEWIWFLIDIYYHELE